MKPSGPISTSSMPLKTVAPTAALWPTVVFRSSFVVLFNRIQFPGPFLEPLYT